MHIAYLILCHKNFEQLDLLVKQLSDGNSDFYIHIDKTVNNYPKIDMPNVFYLENDERIDITWASYQMVEATILLISKCLENTNSYDFAILLSGQDFPICKNSEIQQFLYHNKNSNFIEVMDESNPLRIRYEKRNSIVYPDWIKKRDFFSKCVKKVYIFLTGGYKKTFRVFQRKNSTNLKFYYGSQYWCLREECLRWIYTYVKDNPTICDFFRKSLTPDESFFQTLFMASPYAGSRKGKIVFFEWDKNGNNPRLIDKNKAIEIIKRRGDYLFARKFDIAKERTSIDYVISIITNEVPAAEVGESNRELKNQRGGLERSPNYRRG